MGPLRRCGREDGLTGKVREVRRDGGTEGHPIDRRKGSASARVRASARTPGLQKARQGAAGGGRALSAATPLGPVTAGQCGNLSKRRAYFESVVNHRFESRCCGCAGAVSVRSLRPWQMLTPLASPPQVFTAQRACTGPTAARGAGTNAKNIRRCKGGPGQPPCGRAPRARHLLIRWRWGELGRDVTGQTRGVAAALTGCPSGPTAAACATPWGPGPPIRRCRHAPGGSERRNRRPSFRSHRKSACCEHVVSTPSIQNGRGACFRTAEPAQARDGGGVWRFSTGQGDRGGGGRGGCSGSLAPGTVSQAGLRRGRSGRGWLTP